MCLLNTGFTHVNPNYLTTHLGETEQVATLSASNLQYFTVRSYPMELLNIGHVKF